MPGTTRHQKRMPDFLELKLYTVVSCLLWVLGMEPGLLARTESALNHCHLANSCHVILN